MADIGGAVHGEDIARGKKIVHHAEDAFLHLAGIGGSANEDGAPHEVQENEDFRVDTVALGIGFEFGGGDHGEFGAVIAQFFLSRTNEELADEQVVPGVFVDDANGKAIGGIGAAQKVLYIQVAAPQVFHDAGVERRTSQAPAEY